MPVINLGESKKRDKTVNKKLFQDFYQDKRWRRIRNVKFRNNPLCELCLLKGIITITEEVHHIIPIDVYNLNEELAFDIDNLQSLCVSCHAEIHKSHRQGVVNLR